jgi:hypothetical protein
VVNRSTAMPKSREQSGASVVLAPVFSLLQSYNWRREWESNPLGHHILLRFSKPTHDRSGTASRLKMDPNGQRVYNFLLSQIFGEHR